MEASESYFWHHPYKALQGSFSSTLNDPPMQEHPEPQKRRKQLGNLKESMLKGSPFPRLHAKAAEVKSMLRPTSSALQHFRDLDPSKQTVLDSIVKVLDASSSIDKLVDDITGFKPSPAQGSELEELVLRMNVGITKLCHHFTQQGLFLFNFCPQKPLYVSPG